MPVLPKQFIERLLDEAGSEEEMLAVLDGLGLSISEAEGMNRTTRRIKLSTNKR